MLKLLSYLIDELGVRVANIVRALKLARKTQVVRVADNEIVVLVPSQRLYSMPREKIVSTVDLYSLLQGHYMIKSVKVGKLPTSQQWYRVVIQQGKIECPCPDTIYNRNPLCVHKLAAIISAYLHKRYDILHWLEEYVKLHKKFIRGKTSTLIAHVHD